MKIRVSAIGNVFYAIGNATVSALSASCTSSASTGVNVTGITKTGASINWNPLQGATYSLRYRKVGATAWTTVTASTNAYYLTGLDEGSQYEVQVANVCGSTLGNYSSSLNFTTLSYTLCDNVTGSSDDEFISNVTVTPSGMASVSNTTGASTYTSYVNDATKTITLSQGSSNNVINVTKQWTGQSYNEGVAAWIDFNRDGNFTDSELIFSSPSNAVPSVNGTFSVPANAFVGKNVVMRVMMTYENQPTSGCNAYAYGEIEDYPVNILQVLGVDDVAGSNHNIQIYPNPVSDILNVTNVSDKAGYKIYSAVGQLIGNGIVNAGKINVSSLIKGAYVITIEDKGKDLFKSKFIKK